MRRLARENMMRILAIIVLLALVFGMCAGGSSARVHADTGGELNYDSTNVLDDLKSATVNGQPFNLSAYPRKPLGTPPGDHLCGILLFAVRERQRKLCAVYLCV